MSKMVFEFDREENSVAMLNEMLANLQLSDLHVDDIDGYMATTTQYENGKPASTSHRYGFDRVELTCERDEDEALSTWQVETQVIVGGARMDGSAFSNDWRAKHPDRLMRYMTMITYNSGDAAFVVFHEARK